ncbi:hypothetical protein BKA70DRAFT_1266868 [Coprinopsis sp. MPI-PUGE-AT-0042]|nr:hypothetical protein BKA70DRAFT_1266868 [Coprinopsis sp. MPI-PUGE-AT-0042]
MAALNSVNFNPSPLSNVDRDVPFHLIPRQKPSDWVGPPPWVVRPTALSYPSSSPSSSISLEPSEESIVASPEPSISSSPATVGENVANQATATTPKSGPPVGAIVGGVLGGLALVAAAILVWWFLKRRKGRATLIEEKEPVISPFRTDLERQQAAGGVSGRLSPQTRSSFQTTTSTLAADGAGSQKGYLKSIHSVQRTASTAGSYISTDVSTSILSPTSTTTEDPQVIQAIRTLQTFLQPRMERIPEHHSGAAVAGFVEPTSPPPPAYEDSSSSGDAHRRPSMEKVRIENQ